MRKYDIPTLDVTVLTESDVISTSGGEWELPPVDFGVENIDPANTDNG